VVLPAQPVMAPAQQAPQIAVERAREVGTAPPGAGPADTRVRVEVPQGLTSQGTHYVLQTVRVEEQPDGRRPLQGKSILDLPPTKRAKKAAAKAAAAKKGPTAPMKPLQAIAQQADTADLSTQSDSSSSATGPPAQDEPEDAEEGDIPDRPEKGRVIVPHDQSGPADIDRFNLEVIISHLYMCWIYSKETGAMLSIFEKHKDDWRLSSAELYELYRNGTRTCSHNFSG